MDLNLKNKTAFISGSTAGIGFAIAERLAREGARVIINGRTDKRVAFAIHEIKLKVRNAELEGIPGDLGHKKGCAALVRRLRDFEINVMSGVRLSRAYLPGMRKRKWGRIVFISSESAVQIPSEMIHYGM